MRGKLEINAALIKCALTLIVVPLETFEVAGRHALMLLRQKRIRQRRIPASVRKGALRTLGAVSRDPLSRTALSLPGRSSFSFLRRAFYAFYRLF